MSGYNFSNPQQMLDLLLENPYMFIVGVDKYGKVTLISQSLLKMLGLTEEEVLNQNVNHVIPDGKLTEILETGRIDEADVCCINGREVIVTRVPIMSKGKIIGAIATSVFMDATRTETVLKQLNEKYDTIINRIIDSPTMGYIVINRDEEVTHVNQTYLDILDMKAEDIIGKKILDVIPGSKLPRVLETGEIEEIDLWSVNGHNMFVSRLPIMRNGKVIGAIGHTLTLDLSVPKFLVSKLQETDRRFNAIFEGLIENPNTAYIIVDKDGYVTVMNQTFLDIIGKKREEVIGKHVLEVYSHSKLPETLKTGQMDSADVWPIVEGRDILINRIPIRQNGQIIGAIGHSMVLDMSGAKMLMKRLQETQKELSVYKDEVNAIYQARWRFEDLIGRSSEFVTVKALAQQFAQTSSTLLITGESGTGKELFAQAIHNASSRRTGPFIRINCVTLPENLLESELFGYEDGAFTGAKKGGKPGKFELARGGTVFLDEIGDMPMNMQTKLLSVLQERVIERVGGTKPIDINVRVIAATNQNLEEMVANHEFREDLYYRLNVVRLQIPPLRKRIEDLPVLAAGLMPRINEKLGTNVSQISEPALEILRNYSWPGNVRELENILERAINLAHIRSADCIDIGDLPSLSKNGTSIDTSPNSSRTLNEAIDELEREMIVKALEETGHNKTKTAQVLGIHSSVLYRKLNKYGLN
ncbi:MAG: sigma 54-interacting transcriptional regulator [Syntrophomonadales bacterium]|jgi:transcriptional regulator with PAS, ATPase and Fis domain